MNADKKRVVEFLEAEALEDRRARDLFAAAALTAFLTEDRSETDRTYEIASDAFRVADSMMAERKKEVTK